MRIAIITLPLHTNYGGVLQAYALQKTLEGMGHSVTILQPKKILPEPKGFNFLRKLATRSFRKYVLRHEDVEIFREHRINREFPIVGREFVRFFNKYLNIRRVSSLRQIRKSDYDAFVVGSDQIFRPKYNPYLLHSFLDFTFKDKGKLSIWYNEFDGWTVKRVIYGASFGSDVWEFTPEQTERAMILLSRFEGASFREKSGIKMASENLIRWSMPVLDPTMLLPKEDYLSMIEEYRKAVAKPCPKGALFEYVLDKTDEGKAAVDAFENVLCRKSEENEAVCQHIVRFLSTNPRGTGPVESRIQRPVEEWLGAISDASFVITDSFHACVFSIIFHRPFAVIANPGRGVSRIEWLLEQFALEDRLVKDISEDAVPELIKTEIDWEDVDARLEGFKSDSIGFLEFSLTQARKEDFMSIYIPHTGLYREVSINEKKLHKCDLGK